MTGGACLAALVFRAPLRARYWAWQVASTSDLTQRSLYLAALCNAGDAGRWGTHALLNSDDADTRQYGVLVLHHVRTPWARAALLERLRDADADVRRLAAVGLAMHGEESVIPALRALYRAKDATAATAACVALEYLGTPAAVAALDTLAAEPADVPHRAALVDTLAGIGARDCVPALLRLLDDHRPCDLPPRADALARRVLRGLQAEGDALAWSAPVGSQPVSQTIAERAAGALRRITGLTKTFSSTDDPEEQAKARRAWADWYERGDPPG